MKRFQIYLPKIEFHSHKFSTSKLKIKQRNRWISKQISLIDCTREKILWKAFAHAVMHHQIILSQSKFSPSHSRAFNPIYFNIFRQQPDNVVCVTPFLGCKLITSSLNENFIHQLTFTYETDIQWKIPHRFRTEYHILGVHNEAGFWRENVKSDFQGTNNN